MNKRSKRPRSFGFGPKAARESGFTLIEVMIVVVIIGILAAMALPRFMRSSTRSKQSEAKLILKQIYTNQRTFRQQSQSNSYFIPGGVASAAQPNTLNTIWIEIMQDAKYEYLVVGGANAFTATATANIDDDATIDTWVMDHNGALVNTINDVLN
ncbi:MAG: prepilin-type N-terminal cleavage/methylation domain-containing protein [Candidatus Zixiibacteriota bacterium]|nr:MAG: prepilin-type N-terminal cleavage/methylation domain-containing protein [candidate division Zixibacteria bacterium]